MRVGLLTVSDSRARARAGGDAPPDTSGDAVAAWASDRAAELVWRRTVPDDPVEIVRALLEGCDRESVELLVTTGGTGLAARDVTPESTRAVLEREAPGISDLVRGSAMPHTPRAALGRGAAGVRGRTLIVNLPGAPAAVTAALQALGPVIGHGVDVLAGRPAGHGPAA